MKTNVTLKIEAELLREARVLAAEEGTSISALLATRLEQAVRERGIRAGLDVYQAEPAAGKAPFTPAVVAAPGVYGTHHVGASTDQAQVAIAIEAVRIVAEFMKTGIAPHCVNPRDRIL